MRLLIAISACVAAFALQAGEPALARGGGFTPPNADIRALEPPIDVTEEQLRAQTLPGDQRRADPVFAARQGRSATAHRHRKSRPLQDVH